MTGPQILAVVLCGLLIGLALYLLIRSLRKMAAGKCCEGCGGCTQADRCSSNKPGQSVPDGKEETDL